jgi:hypothetical protein
MSNELRPLLSTDYSLFTKIYRFGFVTWHSVDIGILDFDIVSAPLDTPSLFPYFAPVHNTILSVILSDRPLVGLLTLFTPSF